MLMASITTAILDNLPSNQVVFGWQGVFGCSPYQILHFAWHREETITAMQSSLIRRIMETRLIQIHFIVLEIQLSIQQQDIKHVFVFLSSLTEKCYEPLLWFILG
nr:hypothetical protein CFP56_35326 [Quercus suber]